MLWYIEAITLPLKASKLEFILDSWSVTDVWCLSKASAKQIKRTVNQYQSICKGQSFDDPFVITRVS